MAYGEHSHSERRILDLAQTHLLAADCVVAGVQADLYFRTSCFPAAVDFAVVAAGLELRLCRRRNLLAGAVAAAGFEIGYRPAAAVAAAAR